MGLTKTIKKLLSVSLALCIIASTMSGCVYANNKNWHEMTSEEQEEVRQAFLNDIKQDLEESVSSNY